MYIKVVVFGGNDIRDESGVVALFQEQGASASSMVAAKLPDALASVQGLYSMLAL